MQYLSRKIVENGFQINDFTEEQATRKDPEIKLKYTATSNQLLKEYGAESLLKIIPFRLILPEEPKFRKLPVQLNFPVYRIDSIENIIPEIFAISAIPECKSVSSKYGNYQAEYKKEGNSVFVSRQIIIKAVSYPLTEYRDFYNFMLEIFELENSAYITLTKKVL